MCKGQQSGICESPEVCKVLLMVHAQLEPARLSLLSVDWRAAPCVLTASLCTSRKTINPPTPPLRRGKVKLGIPLSLSPSLPLSLSLSLSLSLIVSLFHFYITNLAAVSEPPLSCPSMWFPAQHEQKISQNGKIEKEKVNCALENSEFDLAGKEVQVL